MGDGAALHVCIYFSKVKDVGSGDDERTGKGAAATKWSYYARRVPHEEGFLLGLGGRAWWTTDLLHGRRGSCWWTLLTLWFSLLQMMWLLQRQMSARGIADKRCLLRKQRVGF